MKKSTLRRLLVLALCLTLVTCTLVGGTLAKYTTKADATDKASVAKWGVTVTATDYTVFEKSYGTAATPEIQAATTTTTDVVAPGAKGALSGFTLSGTPEVAVDVTYAAELTLTNWTVNTNEFYCPIVFTIKSSSGTTTVQQDTTNTDAAKLEKAVEDAIAAYSKNYAANTNLANQGGDTLTVSWTWAYSGTDVDAKDTALGNAASGGSAVPTIELKITTTVTQDEPNYA